MPTFTSTRDILRVENVTLEELFGATLPAGTQLTRVNLTAIDQLSPTASLLFQESDARTLVGGLLTRKPRNPYGLVVAKMRRSYLMGRSFLTSCQPLFSLPF